MIETTQKKLREALFFLSQLERELSSPALNQAEVAAFYFSAFLSAARSVTFVLEAEESAKYGQWSPVWRTSRSESERRLLSRFTGARNRALKRETPNVAEDRLASPMLTSYDNVPIGVRMCLWEDGEQPMGYRVLKCRLTPDDAEEEVAPLCREYAALLSDLVRDFMEAHR
jgi:hypothetical protein